jgi:hypothetical protein
MRKVWKRLRFIVKIRRFIPFLIEFFRSQEVSMLKKNACYFTFIDLCRVSI